MTQSDRPDDGHRLDCPSPETLAAYIDGMLPPDERARVETHLADCAHCHELFVETVRFQTEHAAPAAPVLAPAARVVPFRRRAIVTGAGGLLVAATLLLAVRVSAPVWWERYVRGNARPELVELVAAVGPARPVEARLSGGFAFGPLVSATRGATPAGAAVSPELRIAAARLEQRAAERHTPANVAALGVAWLALGDMERAVTLLEEAAMNEPADALIQNDLAAAYLARSDFDARADDLPRALAATDRAVTADRPIEALFNRALALERLRLRVEADQAWEAYLEHDSTSPWADEARRYLEAGRAGASAASEARDALATDDGPGVTRLAAGFPQETREYIENTLLPSWADAATAGGADADALLRRVAWFSRQLASTTDGAARVARVAGSTTS